MRSLYDFPLNASRGRGENVPSTFPFHGRNMSRRGLLGLFNLTDSLHPTHDTLEPEEPDFLPKRRRDRRHLCQRTRKQRVRKEKKVGR